MKRWVGDMPSPAHSPQVPCPVHGAWTACCLFAVTLFRMPHVVSCIASPQQAAAGCQHGGAFVNATYSPARCVVPPPGVFGVCRGKLVGMANLADRTTPPAVPPYLVKALGLAPHLAAWRARQHSGAPRVALPGDLEQLLVGEVEGRDSLAALLTVRGQTRLWQGGGRCARGPHVAAPGVCCGWSGACCIAKGTNTVMGRLHHPNTRSRRRLLSHLNVQDGR
jgi:hypothetical protein